MKVAFMGDGGEMPELCVILACSPQAVDREIGVKQSLRNKSKPSDLEAIALNTKLQNSSDPNITKQSY
jgi:hypothetical protein